LNEFTGPDLVRYEMSPCKRCFGCQRMEREDFVPPKKCNQAVMMADGQVSMEELKCNR
jgi:hypothetical protein